ncbi:hypothetical protein LCGC14_1844260 [marine sediment metagenome]|uniref:tRNA-guanine(15) transglycosylase-like domain-containing protein n=1 Tax=marine sediment metagenome TaxID=412755 RepID=A0A0F9IRV4_9ZZZZ
MAKVKFFFPDSHDYVDPTFDFIKETNNEHRVIQRDDKYAHELFSKPVYDGILVSKAIVDGLNGVKGRYSVAQRQRFFREGVYKFFRLPKSYETMGDCGAFSYAKEYEPLYTIDEVNEFYVNSGFTNGISLDHIIFDFESTKKKVINEQLKECQRRQEITLTLANDFLKANTKLNFVPYGVAHGWNPESYASSVIALQKMGYKTIALGGMIPLKSTEILSVLKHVNDIRNKDTKFHLLGINRLDFITEFAKFGVTSFDSTSPLMKGLKDDKFNYHTHQDDYTSIGLPQVDANHNMRKLVKTGAIDQNEAFDLEKDCLNAVVQFDLGNISKESLLNKLVNYEKLYSPESSRIDAMNKVLTDKPWKKCPCEICQEIGIHTLLKRGAARNRRRGFHNLYIAYEKLQRELN